MINTILAEEYLKQSFFTLDLNQKNFIYEISVPTCSYRMGVGRMGYIVLLLDSGMILKWIYINANNFDWFRN